jgi:AraC-like DNA-binding protein
MLAGDRADTIHEIIATRFVHVDINYAPPGIPAALGTINTLGHLGICSVRSNAVTVTRTPTMAKDDVAPSIFLGVQMAGSCLVVQNGREAILRPGELVLWDTTAPYTLIDEGGVQQHFFRISISALALPHDALREVSAVTLTPGHPMADLAGAYFRRLASRPDVFTEPDPEAVTSPSVELVRALITTHLDATALTTEPFRATLPLRILEYVRAHLSDPNLSAAQIAAEHNISVRHLYNVLAEGEVSLGDWIRTHRLEECRDELSRPGSRFVTIASIAQRWGFNDPSTFGRLFRTAYGMSPRAWRDTRTVT